MVNKKIAVGLVGAAGVAAATQVPAVQAGVEQLTQKGQDTESLAKATSSSQIKEENVKIKASKRIIKWLRRSLLIRLTKL